MIRRWILGLMGCVLCMNVLAQSLYYTQEDSLRCVQILKELQKDSSYSFGIRVLHTAQKFLGTPYQSATLEKNPEGIVVNFRQLDCTTFVEIVLALAYEAKEDNPDFNGLADYLRLMRYRNGEVSYLNRLHYFSDWLYENQVRGMIMDKTATISRSVPLQLNLSFMSSHPESYPALKAHPDWVGKMQEIESVINKRNSYSYLPKEYIEEVSSKIEDGDIIAFVTNIRGLDVTHVGIAYWETPQKLTFIHASSGAKKVIASQESLADYAIRQKNCRGIWILRPSIMF